MKPPKDNTLENDVAFYLYIKSSPQTRSPDCRDELLKDLRETYGDIPVAFEIKKQQSK